MADYTVSKHINDRDWNGNAEVTGNDPDGSWQVNRSTKKAVMKKVQGRAQKIADELNRVMTVDVYSGSGNLQKTLEVRPSR